MASSAATSLSVPNGTSSATSVNNSHSGSVKSDEIDGSESYGEKSASFGSRNQVDSLEEMSYSGGDSADDNHCGICCKKLTSPRVLSCLHVFCENCLDEHCNAKDRELKLSMVIACPMCQQETRVGTKGAASLPCDYVLTNILDMSAIKNTSVLCTSCKAMENAVARCSDCANFLCPNCNTAHQFMRCFENHKVIGFDDLRRSEEATPIHKPIFCESHPSENMKFYCYTCQVPICNECLLIEHKAPEHQYERIKDAEPRQKEELVNLVNESKARIGDCDHISSQLENALSELQAQRDQAKDLILETFQSYKAILEKYRDKALDDLEKVHSERELEIMDSFHSIEKTVEKIECACQFTNRLLEHGDAIEVLSLHRIVTNQLSDLLKTMPKPNMSSSIEFQTDYNNFEKKIGEAYGKVCAGNHPPLVQSPMGNVDSLPGLTSQPVNQAPMNCSNSLSASSPISLPTSMQSSFEGDPTYSVIPPVSSPNIPPPPPSIPVSIPSGPMHGLTSIQEYNLQQLASLAEKVDISGDTGVVGPSANPSPTPSFTLADLFAGDLSSTSHAINNLQALAKLGNSLGNQDLNSSSINGSNLVLGRGPSPVVGDTPNLASLTGNALLNGFQSISSSTSPILSQGADDGNGDSMHNMPVVMGNTSNANSNTSNFSNHSRSVNPKLTPMQIRCKFGQLGPSKGQFNSPHGFCLGTDEDIIVADTNNHRIQVFEKTGIFKFQFGIPGKEEGQLWYPRKVAVMRNSGKFVVCDRGNERSRMQIFTKNGHFIKKIAIRYIDIVAGLAVTGHGHIVAVDSVSPTVFVISDTGDLLRWFDCSDYMREPSDIAISGKEYFVCDFKGHCVVVFNEDGQFLRRIGCENITNFPNGIDISDAGDVLIGDSHGNRFHVAVFSRDGSLISEFECPYVKVSRCCGLKITSEGYVVTLAKNNHHVLVLNTLYIV
ncbi:B-box type zinc finger protein ncl-1-like [Copidosoma floridanum]|uniref:B-box type zinc finger protein ncl-1-like n=1 Tax=Copidosoma floridanum TaxID=29053 RepID=UPI0006C96541|nr:B-box type zinc finger protein ncl-1-like [Copidosoma floridanum]